MYLIALYKLQHHLLLFLFSSPISFFPFCNIYCTYIILEFKATSWLHVGLFSPPLFFGLPLPFEHKRKKQRRKKSDTYEKVPRFFWDEETRLEAVINKI